MPFEPTSLSEDQVQALRAAAFEQSPSPALMFSLCGDLVAANEAAEALFGHGLPRLAGALAWLGMALSFLPTLRRYRQTPLWAPLLPAVAVFYLAATLGSAWNHHRGRGVVWKRRAYAGEGS